MFRVNRFADPESGLVSVSVDSVVVAEVPPDQADAVEAAVRATCDRLAAEDRFRSIA